MQEPTPASEGRSNWVTWAQVLHRASRLTVLEPTPKALQIKQPTHHFWNSLQSEPGKALFEPEACGQKPFLFPLSNR